ncbi:hypothetical protein BROSI_A2885 [Candidatus Brocadia sinica JPN1]|uniref:Uncharacterized protein n=1 Tax=Candidatus Brocadia sinica JPN1 TaxID=1197129 RepID=A0ABQ0K0S3_9BACT|nr:hypothetical protein BROSI_A2885 [Candidatus Brocadia sinica JPN1]
MKYPSIPATPLLQKENRSSAIYFYQNGNNEKQRKKNGK